MSSYKFEDAIAVIEGYKFLHDTRNIDFFAENTTERIPEHWRNFFYMNRHQQGIFFDREQLLQAPGLPSDLEGLLNATKQLSIMEPGESAGSVTTAAGIKLKKSHEIDRVADLVIKMCKEHNINRVMDIGCGVGHLLLNIHKRDPSLKLLGAEQDATLAKQAAAKFPDSPDVIIRQSKISEGLSDVELSNMFLGDKNDRNLIVSLHGCGWLQPTLLRLFVRLPSERCVSIISIGCCYHRLNVPQIPLGLLGLSRKLHNVSLGIMMSSASLRLASQPPTYPSTDAEIKRHMLHFLHRSTLQAFLECHKIEKTKHFMFKLPPSLHIDNFAAEIKRQIEANGFEWEEYRKAYDIFEQLSYLIEPFTALQGYLQGVLESLLLADRVAFMEEPTCNCTAEIIPIFDACLSPRNMAIVVTRK